MVLMVPLGARLRPGGDQCCSGTLAWGFAWVPPSPTVTVPVALEDPSGIPALPNHAYARNVPPVSSPRHALKLVVPTTLGYIAPAHMRGIIITTTVSRLERSGSSGGEDRNAAIFIIAFSEPVWLTPAEALG